MDKYLFEKPNFNSLEYRQSLDYYGFICEFLNLQWCLRNTHPVETILQILNLELLEAVICGTFLLCDVGHQQRPPSLSQSCDHEGKLEVLCVVLHFLAMMFGLVRIVKAQ
jgi:hypothetical protein